MDDWLCISVFLRDCGLRALRVLRGLTSASDWNIRRLKAPRRRARGLSGRVALGRLDLGFRNQVVRGRCESVRRRWKVDPFAHCGLTDLVRNGLSATGDAGPPSRCRGLLGQLPPRFCKAHLYYAGMGKMVNKKIEIFCKFPTRRPEDANHAKQEISPQRLNRCHCEEPSDAAISRSIERNGTTDAHR